MKIEPFQVRIPGADLDDLRLRLERTRFPDKGPLSRDAFNDETDWDMGTPLSFARFVHKHWLEKYTWRSHEEEINEFSHYKAHLGEDFDSLKVHFIHEKPKRSDKLSIPHKLPILLLHGWPGSFWEFHKVIPKLVEAGFTCVVPSLPGYGFSDKPQTPGYSTKKIGRMMNTLMQGLGYPRYFAQGGDWGSEICKVIANIRSTGCVALHLNMFTCGPPKDQGEVVLEDRDIEKLKALRAFRKVGTGYQAIQGTKPQSLGYGLTDSPIGLACWILEKFSAWSDTHGTYNPVKMLDINVLLTNICIYWFTGTITSSMRLYYETLGLGKDAPVRNRRIELPCAIAELPYETFAPPRAWVETAYNVQRFTIYPKGGHFAALEAPDFFANDVAEYFSSVLTQKVSKL